eukprot:jgi/Mesvir1/7931/Mv11853-RA.1
MATYSTTPHRLPLRTAPTCQYNNLSFGAGQVAFCNLAAVHTLDASVISTLKPSDGTASPGGSSNVYPNLDTKEAKVAYKDPAPVFQSRICSFPGNAYIVLATGTGVQVWDMAGTRMAFSHPMTGADAAPYGDRSPFMRGISAVVTSDDKELLVVGAHTGNLYVFQHEAGKFKFVKSVKEHSAPITDCGSEFQSSGGASSKKGQFFSADQDGNIVVWAASDPNSITKSAVLKGDSAGAPCVGVAARGHSLVAAFSDGYIRVYNLGSTQPRLWVEIMGHTRFLSALAMHPTKDVFVTAAEDSTVNVWSLPDASGKVDVKLSTVWKNAMVCGVAFVGENVAAVAYDYDRMVVWIPE